MYKVFLVLSIICLASVGSVAQDWQAAIDSTWGAGMTTEDKLALFDDFWTAVDEEYAGFQHLDVDWDAMYAYRDTVAAGVSRGRFYGIISHMWFSLLERHTALFDNEVAQTDLEPGVPLFVLSGYNDRSPINHFGAGLTLATDSSLLVYQVAEDHPMGLEPGDLVLGYDGLLWKDQYPLLLEAQLPLARTSGAWLNWGSSEESMEHALLSSAGMNWHLFDTLDIVKYESGDTLHYATSLLAGEELVCEAFENLPVPGVPRPTRMGDNVSWGVIEGTQIGYIYVITTIRSWMSTLFTNAVSELASIDSLQGLIIDLRTNHGGDIDGLDGGYSQLFGLDEDRIKFYQRDPSYPDDHFALEEINCYTPFEADPGWFEKPISLLVGPHCVSGGDYASLMLSLHPMTRTFGKKVNTSLVCEVGSISVPDGWTSWLTNTTGYLDGDSVGYLMHVGFPIDEEIWLERDDVAQGYDTVVESAVDWIQNVAYSHHIEVDKIYARPGIDSVWINAEVENPLEHDLQVSSHIFSLDSSLHDSMILFDDGNHEDGLANDGLWGAGWQTEAAESIYSIDFTTADLTEATSRTIPAAVGFTSVGPIAIESLEQLSPAQGEIPPDTPIYFNLYLQNLGSVTTAEDISVAIQPADTNSTLTTYTTASFGDILPGETVESSRYFSLRTTADCEAGTPIRFNVEIQSGGVTYWEDQGLLLGYVGLDNSDLRIPLSYNLEQNYPNPFNPITTISYALPEPTSIKLTVFDIRGQEVTTLEESDKPPGNYQVQWNGLDATGNQVSTGVYFARLDAGSYSQTIKMVYLR